MVVMGWCLEGKRAAGHPKTTRRKAAEKESEREHDGTAGKKEKSWQKQVGIEKESHGLMHLISLMTWRELHVRSKF